MTDRDSVVVKNTGSGDKCLRLDHDLHYLAVKPCTIYLTSLFLCFFIHKMGRIAIVLSRLHIIAEGKCIR